jgi:peptidoglycan/xylan/chitin deacetylase (PgdA/CDA1 family)
MYSSTAAGLAMVVHAFVVEPPPLWVALLALFAYVGLIVLGVTFSRFSMFADVVTSGPKNARGFALTFDDGPDPRTTPQVLDLLDAAGVKATFFVIGRKVAEHRELTRQIVERGHAIGLHSYEHDRLFSLRSPRRVRGDLERCRELLFEVTGERPQLFRAPIGHISPSMGKVIRDMDLIAVGWSARGVDGWSGARPEVVAGNIVRKLRDGAIVLLHDAAERGDFSPASIEALPSILQAAERANLSVVRLDQWLGIGDPALEAAAHD